MDFNGDCVVVPKGVDELLMIGWVGFGREKDKKSLVPKSRKRR